jgi:transcriptional regulator with XRE-family HTH domain
MTDGQRMLFARKLIVRSQQDFSRMLGISQAALSDIENGKNGISYPVFKRLVEEVGIHPYWFMWGQDPVFRDNSFFDKYNISYKNASPTAGATASPAPKKAGSKQLANPKTTTMDEVLKELVALKKEVTKMKRGTKK